MATTAGPVVGSWVHYRGSRLALWGETFQVVAVYSSHVRLQGIWGLFMARVDSVRIVVP